MNAATLENVSARADTTARPGSDWFAIGVFALVWLELISRLRLEWSINPQYGYGWTVPLLAAYLFWRRSETAPPPDAPDHSALAVAVMLISVAAFVPTRLVQEANPDWRLISWTMAAAAACATAAAVYLMRGLRGVRHFAFPILFFFVAVPWPTQLEQFIIQGLMRADAAINVEVLTALGIPAVQLGNVIEVGSGFVGIDEACTGIRSLQATLMVSLFLGEFYNFNVARRVVLVCAGAVLAFVCNLARTFLLVYVGAEHGSAAIKNWHDPAGMTILVACMFGLWGLSLFLRRDEKPAPVAVPNTRAVRLSRPLLIGILVLAVSAEASTQVWYGAHETENARLKAWRVDWPQDAANWKVVPVAESAQGLLRYNEGGGGTWTGADGHEWTMYFFRWLPGRTAGLFVKNHRPDVCLPASGITQRSGAHYRLMTVNGVTLPIRSYVFDANGQPLHVFYCYWDGTPPQAGSSDAENWTAAGRLDAVKRGKRDVGTQMLEIVAWGYDEDGDADAAAREQLSKIIKPS
ncbi:MAG: exosortase/archaeosortase family protein [Chthoniobacterales bacterium]